MVYFPKGNKTKPSKKAESKKESTVKNTTKTKKESVPSLMDYASDDVKEDNDDK